MEYRKKGTQMAKKVTADELLAHIFENVLPQYEMPFREEQEELAFFILHALRHRKLALYEAGIDTGKIHAYLIASIVYNMYTDNKQPVVIATSTVTMQNAITSIYLPQISRILLKEGIIDHCLTCVERKGKKHYICDKRLESYWNKMVSEKDATIEVLKLLRNRGWRENDLDKWDIPPYLKKEICVMYCGHKCPYFLSCRYQRMLKDNRKTKYEFQVANHGYILGDMLREKRGEISQLPEYDVLIFDEAHCLWDTAYKMYGITLPEYTLQHLCALLKGQDEQNRISLQRRQQLITGITRELFRDENGEEDIRNILGILHLILKEYQKEYEITNIKNNREVMIQRLCGKLALKLKRMGDKKQSLWIEKASNGKRRVCALTKLDEILF